MKKSFDELFEDQTKLGRKIKTDEYHDSGAHIIIDQGHEQIAGYTDLVDGLFTSVPAIIFGDHTRVIKYVDEPFFLGADGVKVLRSKYNDADYKYLYYALKSVKIPNTGYNRHFKWLKEAQIPYQSATKQAEIVRVLDGVTRIISKYQQELSALDDLIKTRFVEMFGDPRTNPNGYEKGKLRSSCSVITGNTPPRSVEEYYGDSIEWIKTDNIVAGRTNPTQAVEFLSEEGAKVGRIVESDTILMACIAGSIASIGRVCITDRKVAFNQQINAVVPKLYDVRFLYVMLQISKDYLVEEINMALKGILSKSKLEDKLFYVPPMELQKQFAAFAEQVDKSKFAVQQALNEAQLLFDSLMQKYFG